MSLHVTIEGRGPDLVLLHGWGLNSAIWNDLGSGLVELYRVHRIDLPGHGASAWNDHLRSLDDWTRAIAPYVPRRATVVGWSLGGMLALRLAASSSRGDGRLVLVSTTPRFLQGVDWPHGMAATTLNGFAQRLRSDYRATIHEFLALQVRGEDHPLNPLRGLKACLLAGGLPQPEALDAGLQILRDSDLRPSLAGLAQPALVVSGQHDRVTPPQAGRRLAAGLPAGRFVQIDRAGHAPFLSHAIEFRAALDAFLAEAAHG